MSGPRQPESDSMADADVLAEIGVSGAGATGELGCSRPGCPRQDAARCAYTDRRAKRCGSGACPDHQMMTEGHALCLLHGLIVDGMGVSLLDLAVLPDLGIVAPAVAQGLARLLDHRVLQALGAMVPTGSMQRAARDPLRLLRPSVGERQWATGWKLFDHTGVTVRAALVVDEASPEQLVGTIGRTPVVFATLAIADGHLRDLPGARAVGLTVGDQLLAAIGRELAGEKLPAPLTVVQRGIMEADESVADQAENQRLDALLSYDIMDGSELPEFEGLARLAAVTLGTQYSAVTVVGRGRQWVKAVVGAREWTETPRETTFRTRAIAGTGPLIIEDTASDSRFDPTPAQDRMGPRFYAAVPLRTRDGHAIGTLSTLDPKVHHPTAGQITALVDLGHQAEFLLEMRRSLRDTRLISADLRRAADLADRAFDGAAGGMVISDLEGRYVKVNRAFAELLGYRRDQIEGHQFVEFTHPDDREADQKRALDLARGTIRSFQVRKRYLHADGSVVALLLSCSLVEDGHGHPDHFFSQAVSVVRSSA